MVPARVGAIGFDEGRETTGACRGAGFLVKPSSNYKCKRRQLRSGGLIPPNPLLAFFFGSKSGDALTRSRVRCAEGRPVKRNLSWLHVFPALRVACGENN